MLRRAVLSSTRTTRRRTRPIRTKSLRSPICRLAWGRVGSFSTPRARSSRSSGRCASPTSSRAVTAPDDIEVFLKDEYFYGIRAPRELRLRPLAARLRLEGRADACELRRRARRDDGLPGRSRASSSASHPSHLVVPPALEAEGPLAPHGRRDRRRFEHLAGQRRADRDALCRLARPTRCTGSSPSSWPRRRRPRKHEVPRWVHLLHNGRNAARDGRVMYLQDAKAMIARTMEEAKSIRIPVDYDHQSEFTGGQRPSRPLRRAGSSSSRREATGYGPRSNGPVGRPR